MSREAINSLLKYGNWSGPGWTAAMRDAGFRADGVSRSLQPNERNIAGIDAYDNFVAKAHDLNEFDAEVQLRNGLASLGLIGNTVTQRPAGRFIYEDRIVYGDDPGRDEDHRFASFVHYAAEQKAKAPGPDNALILRQVFTNYFLHISRSNCQFAIDVIRNPARFSLASLFDMLSMNKQLLFASHLFLQEAADAEARVFRDILRGVGDVDPFVEEGQLYLDANLVCPSPPQFQPIDGREFRPILTRDAMVAESRDRLVKASAELRRRIDQSGPQERLFTGANRDGFGSVADLLRALD